MKGEGAAESKVLEVANQTFASDFFLSYAQGDRAWAEWIAWMLEEDGYQVLVQAWDFVPGSNWVRHLSVGAKDAARTIVVLSDDYLESVYGSTEWQAAWARDPVGGTRRLLIARVADSDRPGLLAGVASVDLFGLSEDEARRRLRNMVSAASAGRAKPTALPQFPGRGAVRKSRFPGSLPRVWNLPVRNPNFSGRGAELRALAQVLEGGSGVTVVSVQGLGGVGKSQLAAEYAYSRAGDYDVAWWISADSPASIFDQFAALASQLGFDQAATLETLQAQVQTGLRGASGWLLIFDNFDTAQDVQAWLPRGPLPAGVPGHVIVTTRRSGFRVLGPVLDLYVLSQDVAEQLLRSRVPGLDQSAAAGVGAQLGCLRLALEEAAAYLRRPQMSGNNTWVLRSRTPPTARADCLWRMTARLWEISFDECAKGPAALQLI
jgi:hypothetical protein